MLKFERLYLVQSLRKKTYRLTLAAITFLSLFAMLAIPLASPASAAAPVCNISVVHAGFPPGPVISANSNFILYTWGVDVPNYGVAPHYFVYNRVNRQTRQASLSYQGQTLANDDSYSSRPAISDNGRLVVFFFRAKNMVAGDTGAMFELYARDLLLNTTELVSQNNGVPANIGAWTPALSTDGRYVAFQSTSTNLTPDDTNTFMDTFVRDRKLGTTERVSIASDGSQGFYDDEYGSSSVDISGAGRYVIFNSKDLKGDDGIVHSGIFLRDRQAQKTYWIANGSNPVMTPDARYIVFESGQKLSPDDLSVSNDLYLYDRSTGSFELLTGGLNGKSEGDDYYFYNYPVINADASQVAFGTNNPNLVADDTNQFQDVFIRDRTLGVTERLTVSANGQEANAESRNPSISADGRYVTFYSNATNLVPSSNGTSNIYLCQRNPAPVVQGFSLYLPLVNR